MHAFFSNFRVYFTQFTAILVERRTLTQTAQNNTKPHTEETEMEYSFHIYNKLAKDGAIMATDKLLNENLGKKNSKMKGAGTSSRAISALKKTEYKHKPPVVVCVGSDLAIGDSLGPITGSMLLYKTQGLGAFIYGTLAAPVTAKEIKYMQTFLKETHADNQIIAIDAAVGDKGDIGLIRIMDTPLLPGAGANKKLGALGDIAIMGIVAEKSLNNYGLLNTTRLNLVYTMAEIISDAVAALLWERCNQNSSLKNA
jgi:putative sporulation protein YyaC